MAPQIDADRVADRDEVKSGAVGDARDLIIPGDEPDAFLAFPLHTLELGNGDFAAHRVLECGGFEVPTIKALARLGTSNPKTTLES